MQNEFRILKKDSIPTVTTNSVKAAIERNKLWYIGFQIEDEDVSSVDIGLTREQAKKLYLILQTRLQNTK